MADPREMSVGMQAAFTECIISVDKALLKIGSIYKVDQQKVEKELKRFAELFTAEEKMISINDWI